MRKIPTLFERDPFDRSRVLPVRVTAGCEWVMRGEGVPTRKFDGVCVMFDGSAWWARREVKPDKTEPPGFREVQADPVTGKRVGWEPIEQSSFARFHDEALADPTWHVGQLTPGTYELVGPRINRNPERLTGHTLIRHGIDVFDGITDPELLIAECVFQGWEGVVWWRYPDDPDCEKAKLKVRDMPEGWA